MIQEKYNRRIFDEGTIEAIENLSHMRSNVLSPVGITKGDNVLIIQPDCQSLVEWLQEKAAEVTVAKEDALNEVKGNFSLIINLDANSLCGETLSKVIDKVIKDSLHVFASKGMEYQNIIQTIN